LIPISIPRTPKKYKHKLSFDLCQHRGVRDKIVRNKINEKYLSENLILLKKAFSFLG